MLHHSGVQNLLTINCLSQRCQDKVFSRTRPLNFEVEDSCSRAEDPSNPASFEALSRLYRRQMRQPTTSLQNELLRLLVMVALCDRADHYIFALWFLLLLLLLIFSSPNLSRRRLDVCHTCTHDVALVRI